MGTKRGNINTETPAPAGKKGNCMKTRTEKTLKTTAGETVTIEERVYESESSTHVGWFFVSANNYGSDFFESVEEAEEFARHEFDIR